MLPEKKTGARTDAFIGMPELCMVYVPVILPLMLALGFDSMTAAATALIGSAAGFTAALTNPSHIPHIAGMISRELLRWRSWSAERVRWYTK